MCVTRSATPAFLIAAIRRRLKQLVGIKVREHGLTPAQFWLLNSICEHAGLSLRELQLPTKHRVSVIAVHDVLNDEMIPVPDPNAPLKDSDTLLVAGKDEDLQRAARVT